MQHVDSRHSFRIGAASSAKDAGILNINIQMLGRWKGTYTDFKQYNYEHQDPNWLNFPGALPASTDVHGFLDYWCVSYMTLL